MKIVDGGEGWTWAKPEDVKPLAPFWKKAFNKLVFAFFIFAVISFWGWGMAFVAGIALKEMLEND